MKQQKTKANLRNFKTDDVGYFNVPFRKDSFEVVVDIEQENMERDTAKPCNSQDFGDFDEWLEITK